LGRRLRARRHCVRSVGAACEGDVRHRPRAVAVAPSLARPPARAAGGGRGAGRPRRAAKLSEPLPSVVDAAWLAARLGQEGLLVADVRGPNAHARGHIPGSIPLVLGSASPSTEREVLEELASEVGLRLRRHGVGGEERLVLYDGGDCVSAYSSAQLAELAGHPHVAVLAGGLAGWEGDLETGVVELDRTRAELTPWLEAFPTLAEPSGRLGDPSLA